MNGAESLWRTAAAAGIDICFANPGTTELALVKALDDVGRIRGVLCLFEGVCSGAADGYARMSGRPAATLLHLGPGLGNAIANLHNARRARSAVLALVGDHATWHRDVDPPLASDIESLARPVSRWVRTSRSPSGVARDAAEAIAVAQSPPGGVATLIVPADCQTSETDGPLDPIAPEPPGRVGSAEIERVAAALRGARRAALYLGARALLEEGQRAAARIAAQTGCRILAETFPARLERGGGLPAIERLPYFPERAAAFLAGLELLVLAGVTEPVSFFGYPGLPSRLTPAGCVLDTLASPQDDASAALEALADALGASRTPAAAASIAAPAELSDGRLDVAGLAAVLASTLPEGVIVIDEAATSRPPWLLRSGPGPRNTLLTVPGGSIGMGPPCATGAALACPERTVVSLQGDGGALYTLQALWTQAREQLHVVTIICANRKYQVLRVELQRAGVAELGAQASALTDLSHPPVDWVSLARGLGVPAVRVETVAALHEALGRGLSEPGPLVIEWLV
jgi:acetolactate synthase-1/2/3 large subunit